MTRSPATVEALLGDERAEEGKNEEERSLAVVGGSGGDGSQGRGSVVAGPVGKIEGGFEAGKDLRWEETRGVAAAARRMGQGS